MKFKVKIKDLNQALNVASMIKPASVDSSTSSVGYLCVVRGDKCSFYSDDNRQKCRVDCPIFEVEGEGAFVYPAVKFKFQDSDGWVLLEPKESDGTHTLHYETDYGFSHQKPTINPKALTSLDKDFESAKEGNTYSSALLREALSLAVPYMADLKSTAPDQAKTVRIYNPSKEEWAKGDGHLAVNSVKQAYFFYSPEFEGKGLSVYGGQLGLLNAFLGKSKGKIKTRHSSTSTYFINESDQVIGWADQVAEHGKFNYLGRHREQFVFRISRSMFVRNLTHIIDSFDRDRIKIEYDHKTSLLHFKGKKDNETFQVSTGVAPVVPEEGDDKAGGASSDSESFSFNVNVHNLLQLVSQLKSPERIELRVFSLPKDGQAIFRTIEDFWMDDDGKIYEAPLEDGQGVYHQCRVTRYVGSMTS